MARIRTIKPEFWESESIGRLSMGARLLFLASLNLADDEGLLRWNEAYLSSQAFVYDELLSEQLTEWMNELVTEHIVLPYKAGKTNQRLAWIINFKRHQVINRPQPSKLPPPSIQSAAFKEALLARDEHTCHLCGGEVDETSPVNICGSKASSIDHLIPQSSGGSDYPSNLKTAHISCNKARKNKPLGDSLTDSVNDSVLERKGKEGEGKGKDKELKSPATATDPCPHQKIIELYHGALPELMAVREWTDDRQAKLRSRWKEKPERQSLEWWADFFKYVAASDFLTGRTEPPFACSLEWLVSPKNFVKVIEGKYENRSAR